MTRSRSISYHLKKSSSRQKQLNKANEWATQWHDDTIQLIRRINDSAGNDWETFDAAIEDLRKLTHRKADALPNIFAILTEPLYTNKQD